MALAIPRKYLFGAYLAASTALTAYAINQALWTRPNVYTAGIELSKGMNMLILTNWLIGWSVFVGKMLQEIMFGELRLIEIEHLYERAWFTVTNLLMTLAMFRSENNLLIFGMIMVLLFMKVFHWILGDRMELLFQRQQQDPNSSLKNVLWDRTTGTLVVFLVMDYKVISSCIDHAFVHSTDVFVVFGLDFLMVYLELLEGALKFALNVTEMIYLKWYPEEEVWEDKVWISKIGMIIISVIRLMAVLFVFIGLIYAYIIPVNFTRDVYVGVVRLVKQLKDFFYFLKAARDLDAHISDATEEDLDGQTMCIICRDDMTTDVPNKRGRNAPKKLPCGHVLHFGCLKSWLERSHCCPTCRREVFNSSEGNLPEWTHHHHVEGENGANGENGGNMENRENRENGENMENMQNANNENGINDGDDENRRNTVNEANGEDVINRESETNTINEETSRTSNQQQNHINHLGSTQSPPDDDSIEYSHFRSMHIPNDEVIPPGWNIVPLMRMPLAEGGSGRNLDSSYRVLIQNDTCTLQVTDELKAESKSIKKNYRERAA